MSSGNKKHMDSDRIYGGIGMEILVFLGVLILFVVIVTAVVVSASVAGSVAAIVDDESSDD